MHTERFETNKKHLPVETLKGPGENGISFCPQRGGIITSMKLKGQEILYLNEESFNDATKNVRGGIPILFPNAGPLPEGSQFSLKQHGFARTSDQWIIDDNKQTETLSADAETKKNFPYDFILKMENRLNEDGSISIMQEAVNREEAKDMPLAMGLHPYFRVANDDKKNIEFDFPGGEVIKNDFDNWSNDGTTSIDNPKLEDPDAVLRVKIPGLGSLVMDISPEYKKIWVWSVPGEDFICIEPVMRDPGGLVNNPELIKPRQAFAGKVNYRLE